MILSILLNKSIDLERKPNDEKLNYSDITIRHDEREYIIVYCSLVFPFVLTV